MKISIVATLYNSAKHIDEFYKRTIATVQQLNNDYEIIFVNDGSPDESLQLSIALSNKYGNITVVDLSRNFGHHKAMMTGLRYASGELIFLIDSDLEEEPEWLTCFFEVLTKNRCDVVYGVQNKRKGGVVERWSGRLFYIVFNLISDIHIPKNIVTARLMTRQFVTELLRHKESELMIAGLWALTGFDQRPVVVKKHYAGKSTYTISRRFSLFVNSITSFSDKPLIGIFYIGLVIFMLSMCFICYLLTNWLFFARPITGWTSVISSIWLLGGLIISFIGIIGVYLSKIFIETKNRPYVIVRRVYGGQLKHENNYVMP